MDAIDWYVLHFIRQCAPVSWTMDTFVVLLSRTDLLKGGVFLAVFWGCWFAEGEPAVVQRRRATLLATLLGTFGALMIARMLALTLPFRLRPLYTPLWAYPPVGGFTPILEKWSSFPSDHAALFFALGAGLFLVSHRLGLVGFAYALLGICLPRLYLGMHYPTDILGGALLGILSSGVAHRLLTAHAGMRHVFTWLPKHQSAFYGLFFLLTYQIATLFNDVRTLARFAGTVAQAILQHTIGW